MNKLEKWIENNKIALIILISILIIIIAVIQLIPELQELKNIELNSNVSESIKQTVDTLQNM